MNFQQRSKEWDKTQLLGEAEIQEILRPIQTSSPLLPLSATQIIAAKLRKVCQMSHYRETLRRLLRKPGSKQVSANTVSPSDQKHEAVISRRPNTHAGSQAKRFHIAPVGDFPHSEINVIIHSSIDFIDGEKFIEEIKVLPAHEGRLWILGLENLVFCDSATLGFLLMAQVYILRSKGRVVTRVRKDSVVHKLLLQSRADKMLKIEIA